MCRTARSSVTLMCSPVNIASRRSSRWTSSARRTSSSSVSSVTRFFDRSTVRSAAWCVRRRARSGSAANQVRRSGSTVSRCTVSAVQDGVEVGSIGGGTGCEVMTTKLLTDVGPRPPRPSRGPWSGGLTNGRRRSLDPGRVGAGRATMGVVRRRARTGRRRRRTAHERRSEEGPWRRSCCSTTCRD
ncbi:Uncharacterised protein [Mycobacteroides abscessus]|nr:Uncharacterised protein [Mycobacteroides abscessus]